MRYAVLLNQLPDGTYQASVPLLPELVLVGNTRDETLLAIRQALVAALAQAEVVYLDVPEGKAAQHNPWLATAGIFADDPTLEPLVAEIYAARDAE
jgi:predicted RNase H-like HicB family nuclease